MPAEAISYTLTNVTQSYSTSPYNFSIRKELNEIGELWVELPFTSEINDKFAHGDTVELYRGATKLFAGVVVEKELNKESRIIRLTILGEEVKLNWTLFSKNGGYRVQYDNVAADQIAADILSGTGYSLAECPTTTLSMRFEYAQRWKALQKLADVLGKDLWLDSSGVHIGDKGSSKTLTYFKTVRKTENSEDIINKVHLLGTGDGINQYTATAEDTNSQNTYGLRERAYMLRDIEHEDTLLLKAQKIIADNKDPVERIEIEAPFSSDILPLDVGDTITINDSELGLSGDYRIKRLEINPTTVRAELVNTIALLSDKLKEYYNGLESLGVYAQGATNLYSVQDSDNADPNHPLELKIYVPPEAIKINRVKLNLVVGPFRAYSKATKGGGAATVTSAAGGATTVATTTASGGGTTVTSAAGGGITVATTTASGGATTVATTTASGGATTQTSEASGANIERYDQSSNDPYVDVNLSNNTFGYTATATWKNVSSYTLDLTPVIASNIDEWKGNTVTLEPNESYTVTHGYSSSSANINAITARTDEGWTSYFNVRLVVDADATHTHSVSIPDHTHDVSIDIPDHTHDVTITLDDHSHSVSIPDHTHDVSIDIPDHTHDVSIPDHTHDIDFGIYEIDTSATVDIVVNGTTVKTGSTGETDLDITPYITTGWNTITLTPSDLARIQASVFFQVFIQSR